jgi:hypothetical protein
MYHSKPVFVDRTAEAKYRPLESTMVPLLNITEGNVLKCVLSSRLAMTDESAESTLYT